MFSYKGSKSRVIHLYPPPRYSTIVEPFCGSARYACRWGLDRDVWLNDLYEPVYKIWRWLIHEATEKDIRGLPELEMGQDLRDVHSLIEPERLLLGFAVAYGIRVPHNRVTRWSAAIDKDGNPVGNEQTATQRLKINLLPLVGRIGHWRITRRRYKDVVTSAPATYFIDPPYQRRKSDYVIKNGNGFYPALARYCRKVPGEAIVCESEGADWLRFNPLWSGTGQQYRHFTTRGNNYGMKGNCREVVCIIRNPKGALDKEPING